ncbi:LOW QUALITY PROTEIN: carbonic anhydrase Nec1-like [Primulina huaijiensis]|uniref:LOW QUALITY PROTEIN: carbonic anhydrase Nec1-like n=1 Tax=Primulina huaijiensis TaxID=1492673 RepID=UPI003CC71504
MKSRSKPIPNIHALFLVIFIIFIQAKSSFAQEVDNERDFDYSPDGNKGPRKWGEIKKEWGACNNGDMQSPIDLSNERVVQISQPENMNFKASNATFKNRGHDIQIKWIGDAGSIFINDTVYRLRYAHWHSPSEHTINGIRYDMELHLVHLTEDPEVKIAVIEILYTIGKSDYFLSKLMTNISSMVGKRHVEMSLGIVDPNDIIIRSKRFYRYMGSLTIPPCTEGVIWTINKVVKSVSKDQVKLLREAVQDYAEENARPLQQINNRGVHLYNYGSDEME